jgi:phage/plasmid-like protein (TIGR03299 family)
MAHEVESMAYRNAVPWHGLGANVTGDVSDKEFLVAAGLDWTVDLWPMKAHQPGEDKTIDVAGRYALVRSKDKKVMTITGPSWQPLQNAQVLGFMQEYVNAGGATLETAGSLRDGKIVWGLAKLKHSFNVTRSDRVEGYLLMTSPHVVGQAISIRTTTVRVVCANTLALAQRQSDINYSQSHLKAFDFDAARTSIGNAHEHLREAEKRAKTINALKINLEDAVRKVIVPVFMPEIIGKPVFDGIMDPDIMPDKIAGIVQSINTAPGAIANNGWGVLNGVTHWVDHVAGRDNASRMFRSWMGDYSNRKLETEQKLLELAA